MKHPIIITSRGVTNHFIKSYVTFNGDLIGTAHNHQIIIGRVINIASSSGIVAVPWSLKSQR